jgi:hypothetical protein
MSFYEKRATKMLKADRQRSRLTNLCMEGKGYTVEQAE